MKLIEKSYADVRAWRLIIQVIDSFNLPFTDVFTDVLCLLY